MPNPRGGYYEASLFAFFFYDVVKEIHGPHLMEGMRDKEYQEAVIQVKLRKILMQLH